jgi:hypothetical protein
MTIMPTGYVPTMEEIMAKRDELVECQRKKAVIVQDCKAVITRLSSISAQALTEQEQALLEENQKRMAFLERCMSRAVVTLEGLNALIETGATLAQQAFIDEFIWP